MATSPRWKVYNLAGVYIAACKFAEDAAALVAIQGAGATIRDGHKAVVYTQGVDGDAGESYDRAATLCCSRARDRIVRAHALYTARLANHKKGD